MTGEVAFVRELFTSLLTIVGLLLITVGVAMIDTAAGVIAFGVAFIVVGETEGRR